MVLVELGRPREVRVGFAQRRLGLTLGGFGLDGGGDRRVRIRAVERQYPLALLDGIADLREDRHDTPGDR